MTYDEIRRDIKAQKYKPIYFLCGEEPFFIDSLTRLLEGQHPVGGGESIQPDGPVRERRHDGHGDRHSPAFPHDGGTPSGHCP